MWGTCPMKQQQTTCAGLFSVAGTVTSVHIITDPATGKSKGCGYVQDGRRSAAARGD
jgi:hypothetical protein